MELLRGGELFDRICGRSIFTEEEAFRIIHRDIKVSLSKRNDL